jgi:hypothetical protein
MFGDLTDDEFETLDAERLQTLISSEVNTSDVISEVVFTKIVETEESQKHFDVREEKEKVLDFSE